MRKSKDLQGKVVLISGGSSGIGQTAAREFARRGATVFELSRSGQDYPGVRHLTADITEEGEVRAAVAEVLKEAGKLDIVLSNAGYGIAGPLEYSPLASVERQMDVNFLGAVRLIQAVLPALRANGGGRIIVISSVAANVPIPFQTIYTCSKAALNYLVLGMNNELRPLNISLVALLPGDTKTGFTDKRQHLYSKEDAIYGQRATASIQKMENDERAGAAVEPLARRIVKLATQNSRPRPLQGIGFFYRLTLVLAKILPARSLNYLLYQLYAKEPKVH